MEYTTKQKIYSFEAFELPELNDKNGNFDGNKEKEIMKYEKEHEDARYFNEYLRTLDFIGDVTAKVDLEDSKDSPEVSYIITLKEENYENFEKDFQKILAMMIGYDDYWKELTFEQACEESGIDPECIELYKNYEVVKK